jgi:predicted flap endonuclease-1-like 5' DNA nuclease
MIYLAQTFWLPLTFTLIGGLVWGLLSPARPSSLGAGRLVDGLAMAIVAAGVASVLKWLPGRPGLWLDTALLFALAYVAGCVVGGLVRSPAMVEEPVPAAVASPAPPVTEPMAVLEAAAKSLTGAAAAADAMARGSKPEGLDAPRAGPADDLKLVSGIGPQNEARLHALGIYHFDQIARWSEKEALWVGGYLAFPGRIEREDWIEQAKILAAGGETNHSQALKREAGGSG